MPALMYLLRPIGIFILSAAMLLAAVPHRPALAEEAPFQVIAHPGVTVSALSPQELGRIYRRTVTEWEGGTMIVPVELGGASGVRKAFYKATMKISVGSVAAYWINQAMTTGLKPPRAYPSDELVITFVSKTPGAIGFVSGTVVLPATVKRITIR